MGKTYRKQRSRDEDYDDYYGNDVHGMKQHDKDIRKKKRFTRAIKAKDIDGTDEGYEDGADFGP